MDVYVDKQDGTVTFTLRRKTRAGKMVRTGRWVFEHPMTEDDKTLLMLGIAAQVPKPIKQPSLYMQGEA